MLKNFLNMEPILLGFIGSTEMWLILVGIIVLFGAKRIPELMKGVGQGLKEFKNAKKEVKEEIEDKDEK